MKYTFAKVLATFALCTVSNISHAALAFDGGDPNQLVGYAADQAYYGTEAATQFALNSAITANTINWWGGHIPSYSDPALDSFTMNIYSGGSSTPGSLLYTFDLGTGSGVLTGISISNSPGGDPSPEYLYSAAFGNVNLGLGTYFLSLSNANPSDDMSSVWAWETTSGGSQLGGATQSGGIWGASNDENLAFKLYNNISPVPEPETYWMLLTGLCLIGFIARRKNRNGAMNFA